MGSYYIYLLSVYIAIISKQKRKAMMYKNIFKTIAKQCLYLMIIVFLSFLLPRLIPGNPLYAIAGEGRGDLQATAAMIERFEQYFAINEPIYRQFIIYLNNLI